MKAKYIIILLAFVLVWGSCHKEQNSWFNYNDGIESSKTFVQNEQMMIDLMKTYFKSIGDSLLFATGKSKIDGADIYYIDTLTKKSILIKYPDWGKDDGYGHWRMYSYEATTSTDFNAPDALVTFKFNNFLYDKNPLNSKKLTIQNMGKPDGVNDQYHLVGEEVIRVLSDTAGTLVFDMDQYFLRFKDPSSLYFSINDSFAIWGTLNGSTNQGLSYESSIEPDSVLINNYICNFLKNGPASVHTDSFKYNSRVFFPGEGTCVNQFTVVINNNFFLYPINTWN
ncbi:MAG: hypothetical protein GXO86_09715 [Chlorobi bacterium]|nr:hypothetical protein [Chlorobiota bacterium]